MNYGERLKYARKKKNMTQQQLAESSGVPQGTISKIERGDQGSSAYDTVLAHALDVPAIWLSTGRTESFKGQTIGVEEVSAPYSKEELDLMTEFRKLSPADKARLLTISKALNPKLDKENG